jgi:hypothetical protein
MREKAEKKKTTAAEGLEVTSENERNLVTNLKRLDHSKRGQERLEGRKD